MGGDRETLQPRSPPLSPRIASYSAPITLGDVLARARWLVDQRRRSFGARVVESKASEDFRNKVRPGFVGKPGQDCSRFDANFIHGGRNLHSNHSGGGFQRDSHGEISFAIPQICNQPQIGGVRDGVLSVGDLGGIRRGLIRLLPRIRRFRSLFWTKVVKGAKICIPPFLRLRALVGLGRV